MLGAGAHGLQRAHPVPLVVPEDAARDVVAVGPDDVEVEVGPVVGRLLELAVGGRRGPGSIARSSTGTGPSSAPRRAAPTPAPAGRAPAGSRPADRVAAESSCHSSPLRRRPRGGRGARESSRRRGRVKPASARPNKFERGTHGSALRGAGLARISHQLSPPAAAFGPRPRPPCGPSST